MPSPSGSAALLYAHFRERRLSLTTFIVMLYLFVNITGRFSVALFGLTYNLLDDPDMKIPVLVTQWDSLDCSVLLTNNLSHVNSSAVEKGLRKNSTPCDITSVSQQLQLTVRAGPFLDLAIGGLATLTRRPSHSVPLPSNHEIYETLAVNGSTLYEIDGGVNLTYSIRDYDGTKLISSGRNVSTRTSCAMFYFDDFEYWEDPDDDQTFKGMLSKPHSWTQMEGVMKLILILEAEWDNTTNTETTAEVLRALYDKSAWSPGSEELVAWAAPLDQKSNEFSMTCK